MLRIVLLLLVTVALGTLPTPSGQITFDADDAVNEFDAVSGDRNVAHFADGKLILERDDGTTGRWSSIKSKASDSSTNSGIFGGGLMTTSVSSTIVIKLDTGEPFGTRGDFAVILGTGQSYRFEYGSDQLFSFSGNGISLESTAFAYGPNYCMAVTFTDDGEPSTSPTCDTGGNAVMYVKSEFETAQAFTSSSRYLEGPSCRLEVGLSVFGSFESSSQNNNRNFNGNLTDFTVYPEALTHEQVDEACSYIVATNAPTVSPTLSPTVSPTESPTTSPTTSPTSSPTMSPTTSPTTSPTSSPSTSPTTSPTAMDTESPTVSPTNSPTSGGTESPTTSPTSSPTVDGTMSPTTSPTSSPTIDGTESPTTSPTSSPTVDGTVSPTTSPTSSPTIDGTVSPTSSPTSAPSIDATDMPSMTPTESPSGSPTLTPSMNPTVAPSDSPAAATTCTVTVEASADETTLVKWAIYEQESEAESLFEGVFGQDSVNVTLDIGVEYDLTLSSRFAPPGTLTVTLPGEDASALTFTEGTSISAELGTISCTELNAVITLQVEDGAFQSMISCVALMSLGLIVVLFG